MRVGKLTPGTKGISQARVRKEYGRASSIGFGAPAAADLHPAQETSRQSSMTQRGFGEVVVVLVRRRSSCQ